MIEFSANNFVSTLISIITDSPTSILFIILGIIFSVAMIINVKKNKTIGKSLFIIGWIFIILFIIIKYNEYISKMFDNLINNVFMQIFFPNLATYIIIIVITNIIFLHTILINKNSKTSEKIINSLFFSSIMVLMVYTLDLIIESKINIYNQKELYTNEQVLTLIESTTIIFSLWFLIMFSKFLIKKLIKKSNEKIKEEFEKKEINNQTQNSMKSINQIPETTTDQDLNNNDWSTIPQVNIQKINESNINRVNTLPTSDQEQINPINVKPVAVNTEPITSAPTQPSPVDMINPTPSVQENIIPPEINISISNSKIDNKVQPIIETHPLVQNTETSIIENVNQTPEPDIFNSAPATTSGSNNNQILNEIAKPNNQENENQTDEEIEILSLDK